MNLAEKQGLPPTGDEEGARYLSVQLVLSWDEQRTGLAKGLANQKHNLESGVSDSKGKDTEECFLRAVVVRKEEFLGQQTSRAGW